MRQIILFLFLIHSGFCYSQNDSINFKWNFGLQINFENGSPVGNFNSYQDYYEPYSGGAGSISSITDKNYSGGLTISRFLRKNTSVGLKCGVSKFKFTRTSSSVSSSGLYTDYLVGQQNSIYFTPTKFWYIPFNKILIKGGLFLPLTIYGKYTSSFNTTYNDFSSITTSFQDGVTKGGCSFGGGIALGFDVLLTKKIMIGGELDTECVYLKLGGKKTYSTKMYDGSNVLISDNTIVYNQTINRFGLVQFKGVLSISFLF